MTAMSTDPVVPSREEPVVRGAAQLLGGPLGRHGRPRGVRTVLLVVLLATAGTFALGYAQKAPCRNPGKWADQYAYTRLCYSDIVALYGGEGLSEGKRPYRDHPVEYPVVIGGAMGLAAKAVADQPAAQRTTRFYDVTAVMLLGAALVMAATTVYLAGRRRPWDAALVAFAPGLVIHGLTNWDLLAAATAGLAMLAWARRKPWLAGVLIGVGGATKLYPLIFLGPLLVLCWRTGQWREWQKTAIAAANTFVVIYGIAALGAERFTQVAPDQFARDPNGQLSIFRFFSLSRTRGADWDSLWFMIQRWSSGESPPARVLRFLTPGLDSVEAVNTVVFITFAIAMALLTVLILKAPRRPRVAQVLFLAIAAFLLCNKVNSPQFTIWLIPLAALARPRWGAFLTWQLTECFVLFTRFYYFYSIDHAGKGVPQDWFLSAILVRDIALVVVMGLVVREVLRPEEDVVRAAGDDDPAGGVLDGAPDRVREPRRRERLDDEDAALAPAG